VEFVTTNEFKEINYHVKRCPKIEIECKYCRVMVIRNELNLHYDNCSEFTVICPNCSANYKKSQQVAHLGAECINNLKNLYEGKKKEGNYLLIV
jgi:hypothetical protein